MPCPCPSSSSVHHYHNGVIAFSLMMTCTFYDNVYLSILIRIALLIDICDWENTYHRNCKFLINRFTATWWNWKMGRGHEAKQTQILSARVLRQTTRSQAGCSGLGTRLLARHTGSYEHCRPRNNLVINLYCITQSCAESSSQHGIQVRTTIQL